MGGAVCRTSFLLIPLAVFSLVEAQVIIRDSIAIDPQPLHNIVSGSAAAPLLRLVNTGFATVVETTVPGVTLSASVSATPSDVPEGTGYEVWFSAGGSSSLILKKMNGCPGSPVVPKSPFPVTLASCGRIAVTGTTFVPAPFVWSCGSRQTGVEVSASGNEATFRLSGTMWYTSFTATVTVSASLTEEGRMSEIIVTPVDSSLDCAGATVVNVLALNGLGDVYLPCQGALKGTATLQAKGAYARLISGSVSGSTVPISLLNGKGSVLLDLDDSRGIIPDGFDQAEIVVEIEGIKGKNTVIVKCAYPPPTVSITHPFADTTILLSEQNLPTLTFREVHTPDSGRFEPSITWKPDRILETARYFDQIQDSTVVQVTVEAQNDGGKASDSRKIILKKACNNQPPLYRQGDPLWAKDLYDHSEKTISRIGCALSSMAMAMTALGDTVNPGELNTWMKSKPQDEGGFHDNAVNWNAIRIRSGDAIQLQYWKSRTFGDTSKAASLDDLRNALVDCAIAIVQVFNTQTNNQHWVVVVSKSGNSYQIVDPGRGETTLAGYGNRIWSYLTLNRRKN